MKIKALASHVIRDHVLVGGIAAWLLIPYFGLWGSGLFWFSTVFVDIDHYFHFLRCVKWKHFGIRAMFRFHEELFVRRHRPELLVLEVFHTMEFILLLALLAFGFIPFLIPVFWGVAFHNVIDYLHLSRYGILGKRVYSFTDYKWRKKKLREKGLDTQHLIEEVLAASNLT